MELLFSEQFRPKCYEMALRADAEKRRGVITTTTTITITTVT